MEFKETISNLCGKEDGSVQQQHNCPLSALLSPCSMLCVSMLLQCWVQKKLSKCARGGCLSNPGESQLAQWIINVCLPSAQRSTSLDHVHIPTLDSPGVRTCLFRLACFQAMSTFYDMSICYLNKNSSMGNVAQSSLKIHCRLLSAASRLAATNEFH